MSNIDAFLAAVDTPDSKEKEGKDLSTSDLDATKSDANASNKITESPEISNKTKVKKVTTTKGSLSAKQNYTAQKDAKLIIKKGIMSKPGVNPKKAAEKDRNETGPSSDKIVKDVAKLPPIDHSKYAYRHYISLHPCQNKILEMKWNERERNKHLDKIQRMKAQVDNARPKVYLHLVANMKKKQVDKERQEEIERDNRKMLARMSNIVFLESHDPEIHATKHKVMTNAGPRARAKKLHLIAMENKKLLERLQAQKPEHNRKELLEESYKRLAKLENMSSFPQQYAKAREEYQKGKYFLPKLVA